nr:uncharacterized protein LOC123773991 isoform X1 [Procambarus clarkii]
MYSIKWYQGAHEFYRYTPTFRDPIQVFDPPTLDVDLEKSWGGSVRIANVSLGAEGPFHCEVSADGPTFHTASDSASLTVVDLPDGVPVIKGVRSHYLPGSWVDLTCTSFRSKPAVRLSFVINTQPVSPGWLEPQSDQTDEEGLTTSSLRLRFSLRPRQLEEGEVRVECISEIPGVYRESSQDVLSTSPPYHASVRGGSAAPAGTRVWPSPLALALSLLLLAPIATHPLL